MSWIECENNDEICRVFTAHVLPIMTTIFTMLVGSISLPVVFSTFKSRKLPAGLNPLPFPWLLTLCLMAVIYGFYLQDYALIVSNIPGVLISMASTLVFYDCANVRQKTTMLISLLVGVGSCLACGLFSFVVLNGSMHQPLPIGVGFAMSIALFYSSPLTCIVHSIRNRTSSPFYLPLVIVSALASTSWVVYGIFLGNFFIIVPNGLASMCCFCQLILCIVFPRECGIPQDEKYPNAPPLDQMMEASHCKRDSSTATKVIV